MITTQSTTRPKWSERTRRCLYPHAGQWHTRLPLYFIARICQLQHRITTLFHHKTTLQLLLLLLLRRTTPMSINPSVSCNNRPTLSDRTTVKNVSTAFGKITKNGVMLCAEVPAATEATTKGTRSDPMCHPVAWGLDGSNMLSVGHNTVQRVSFIKHTRKQYVGST